MYILYGCPLSSQKEIRYWREITLLSYSLQSYLLMFQLWFKVIWMLWMSDGCSVFTPCVLTTSKVKETICLMLFSVYPRHLRVHGRQRDFKKTFDVSNRLLYFYSWKSYIKNRYFPSLHVIWEFMDVRETLKRHSMFQIDCYTFIVGKAILKTVIFRLSASFENLRILSEKL